MPRAGTSSEPLNAFSTGLSGEDFDSSNFSLRSEVICCLSGSNSVIKN